MQLMPEWFDEWVIISDDPNEAEGWKLKDNAPPEIQEAFKLFMNEERIDELSDE